MQKGEEMPKKLRLFALALKYFLRQRIADLSSPARNFELRKDD